MFILYSCSAGLWWWSESESCSVVTDSLLPHGLYRPRNSPGQNTGVGCHSLLQGIFPIQGLNTGLSHCRHSLAAEPQGKPKNTGMGSLSSHIGSSQPRNWTGSPALQADSLPTELSGKPWLWWWRVVNPKSGILPHSCSFHKKLRLLHVYFWIFRVGKLIGKETGHYIDDWFW